MHCCKTCENLVCVATRDALILDTYIGIGHFWQYRIGIVYSVSIQYHNRYSFNFKVGVSTVKGTKVHILLKRNQLFAQKNGQESF